MIRGAMTPKQKYCVLLFFLHHGPRLHDLVDGDFSAQLGFRVLA